MHWGRGFGSHASEAPRQETLCHVQSGTVGPHNAARPCGDEARRMSQECGPLVDNRATAECVTLAFVRDRRFRRRVAPQRR